MEEPSGTKAALDTATASMDPEGNLHTQQTNTGYQPYRLEPTEQGDHPYGSPARGTVAATSYGPMKGTDATPRSMVRTPSRGSSSSVRGKTQVQLESKVQTLSALLEAHGIQVPEVQTPHDCSKTHTARNDGQVRPEFSEAEQKILHKGWEVAEQPEEVGRAEHAVEQQRQATMGTWKRTEQREEASRRLMLQRQQTCQDAERAREATSQQIQVAQVQTQQAAQTAALQIEADRSKVAQQQQAVDIEKQRTLELQIEMDRRLATKQQEPADVQSRLESEQARQTADAKSIVEANVNVSVIQQQMREENQQLCTDTRSTNGC